MLKRRVDHRKKEVDSIEKLFDKIDGDNDGNLDITDFKALVGQVGLVLNDKEMYSAWNSLDSDKSGEVDFETFFS